jgi:hypothetical protein
MFSDIFTLFNGKYAGLEIGVGTGSSQQQYMLE